MNTLNVTLEMVAGIALLDEKRPGWATEKDTWDDYVISLGTLDIRDIHSCILGQLFGRYSYGLTDLGLSVGYRHGFSAKHGANDQELTPLWRAFIVARRDAAFDTAQHEAAEQSA